MEAAAERAAAQSAAIIEEAMAQAEETRRRAEQDTQSQVSVLPGHELALRLTSWTVFSRVELE